MKPIAKAMAVAWSAAALIIAGSATAGARKAGVIPPPDTGQRQTIAAEAEGFVIRVAVPEATGGKTLPPVQTQLIPIGADMHLDARILAADRTK